MHFDTEEGTLQRLGQIDHPAVTAVCYLKGKGDPTVVFNQSVFDEDPTEEAYVSHPVEDSVLIYPGDKLHCVCPSSPKDKDKKISDNEDETALPQRVTLMVAFWDHDISKQGGKRKPLGACAPTPRASRGCEWPRLLDISSLNESDRSTVDPKNVKRSGVTKVSSPWEDIRDSTSIKKTGGLKRKELEDPWRGALIIPEERNQRFFVKGMTEFKEHLDAAADCAE